MQAGTAPIGQSSVKLNPCEGKMLRTVATD